MEDYTGKTNEDLLELLEDLNEQQEMFEDDLDDPDYKNMYDKNAEEIIKIKEALNEAESSTIDSEPMEEEVSMPVETEESVLMEEEVSMPVEAEDSMSMEEIEVYMPEEDEDKLSTDLDQNTLDEIEDDEREFAEETGSNKSEQIERMNEQLNEMLGPKPTESKREVEENLESIKFSDIKIDKSLFFAKGGKTKIGIYEEGGKLKVVNISRVTGGMSPVFRVKFNDGFEMRSSTQDEFIDSEYYKVMDKAIMNYINPQKPIGSTSEQDLYNYEKGGELNKGDVVMQTGEFAESGDYYVVEKDKGNTDGETDNHYQLSEVRKKEQGWFEENDLEKLYAKGGYLEGKTYYIVNYYSSVSDIPKGIPLKNKSFDTKEVANTFLKSIENKGGRGFITDFRKPTQDEISKLDRDRNENYMMAKGGEVTYTDTDNYANRRMGNGGIKIWENYKNINNQKAVGSFSHTYNKRNVGDYYLFLLDDYDRNFYSHIALKPNEMLFRNETERGRISKSLPLIKINIKNGRVYFLSEENDYNSDIDDKNPKFSKASADVNYLSLDDRIKKYNQGLITYDELSESVDKTYAKGGTITGAGKSGLDKIKKTSKDNPSQMYKVTDDNYSNIGNFYLKNGKFAKKTVSNADYDFAKNKVSLRPKSDVIYKATEIEGKGGYFEKGGEINRSKGSSGRYHILSELKGQQPSLYASTNDKKSISKLVEKAEKDLKVLTNKKHNIFVTDSVEDREIYNFEKGGKVDSWEYKWGSWEAEISKHPRRNEYRWSVYDKDGNDTYDFNNDIDAELETPLEAENNMFRNINDRIGHSPERKISTYEKGGETASPITNYKKNIMGTLSFDLKVKGMRKPQDFIVYPITEKTDKIRIQSDKKFGEIHLPTGNGVLSKSGNTSWHLASDMMNRNINKFELSESEMKELKDKIKATTGKSVGSSFVKSDNSGAELLAEGGKLDMGEVDIYEGVDGDCTVVMHGDVFEMNQHTMPNMSIDMYSGSRSEYPADISHWGKKIDFKDAPIVIKDKVEARTEEFKKGGKLKEDNRKWSHRMWFTNSSPDDEYYYENNVIDYLVENPSTFKLTVNRRKLNDYNTLMSVYKDMEIEPGSTYLNPKDIKEYAIKNNRYEWLKIEGDRGSEVRERVIKKYVDRIKEYSDYSEGFDAKELLEQIQILESMAFEEKDEVVRDELRKEANKMRTQL
tara:strand:+ start:11307 stop:14891 length:3585 start_codon:yes stop_codon:yes gene_type:complete